MRIKKGRKYRDRKIPDEAVAFRMWNDIYASNPKKMQMISEHVYNEKWQKNS